jgi:hypothetical protein
VGIGRRTVHERRQYMSVEVHLARVLRVEAWTDDCPVAVEVGELIGAADECESRRSGDATQW